MSAARKVIFYLFVIIYLVLCPLLILYARGYILDPVSRELEHTGVVYLSTFPSGANIYLGKSRYRRRTPAAIEELLPGRYNIKITLKNHKPWTHTVSVEPGRAAAFDNILLIPLRWQKEGLSGRALARLTPVYGGDYLIAAQGENLGDFFVYDIRDKTLRPLLAEGAPYAGLAVSSVFTEVGSRAIIIYGGPLYERRWLYIDLKSEVADVVDISGLISERPDYIVWDADYSSDIFTVRKGRVDRIDTKALLAYGAYLEGARGLGISGNRLFVLDEKGALLRYSFDKREPDILFDAEELDRALLSGSAFYRIEALDDDIFIFLDERGRLTSNIAPYLLAGGGVRKTEFYRPNKKLLYWTKDSIFCADFSKNEEEPSASKSKEKAGLSRIYSAGEDIRQSFWAYGGSHIIFRDTDALFLLEIEPQGPHHVKELTKIKRGTSVFYSQEGGRAYYIDGQTSMLSAIKVAPEE